MSGTADTSLTWYFVGLLVSSPINVLGLFLLLLVALILARAQGKGLDLSYLLLDSQIGKVTLAKFTGFGAFTASTWIVVQQAVIGKLDAGMFTAYIAGWGAVKVAQDYFNSKAPEPAAQQETTTTTKVVVPQAAVKPKGKGK